MRFREVTIADAQLLYDWRNDPDTRAMSRDTSEIAYDDHVAWLERRLSRGDHGLFIAEQDGVPVGTIRLDHDEISYTVAPSHRRKGIGETMLIVARETFGQKVAEVKRDNVASIKLAERAGHLVRFID